MAQVAADIRALASLKAAKFEAENGLAKARTNYADFEKKSQAALLEADDNTPAAEAAKKAAEAFGWVRRRTPPSSNACGPCFSLACLR